MAVEAEKAIVEVEVEEAMEDKNKSSHRSIGRSNKDEGSGSGSGSISNNDSGGVSDEILVKAPTMVQRWSDNISGEAAAVAAPARWWAGGWKIPVEQWVHQKNLNPMLEWMALN